MRHRFRGNRAASRHSRSSAPHGHVRLSAIDDRGPVSIDTSDDCRALLAGSRSRGHSCRRLRDGERRRPRRHHARLSGSRARLLGRQRRRGASMSRVRRSRRELAARHARWRGTRARVRVEGGPTWRRQPWLSSPVVQLTWPRAWLRRPRAWLPRPRALLTRWGLRSSAPRSRLARIPERRGQELPSHDRRRGHPPETRWARRGARCSEFPPEWSRWSKGGSNP